MKKMYKGFLFVAALAFLGGAVKAQGNFPQALVKNHQQAGKVKKEYTYNRAAVLPQSVIELSWNGGSWDTLAKRIFSYTNEIKTSEIYQSWTPAGYENTMQELWQYNAKKQLLRYESQNWNTASNSWEYSTLDTTAYDAFGQQTLTMQLQWNLATSQWDTLSAERNIITYNTANKPVEIITETYVSGTWSPSSQATNTFNTAGFLTSSITSYYNSATATYDPSEKTIISYNASNVSTTIEIQTYDSASASFEPTYRVAEIIWQTEPDFTGGADLFAMDPQFKKAKIQMAQDLFGSTVWVDLITITATYSSTGKLLTELYEYNPMFGQPNTKTTNTYDANDNLTETYTEEFDSSNSTWTGVSGERHSYVYHSSGAIMEDSISSYDPNTMMWDAFMKLIYDNGSLASVKKNSSMAISVFPNPAVESIRVACEEAITRIRIVDAQGREVMSVNGQNAINISNLAKGNYILDVITGSGTSTRTIVKQ